MSEKAEAGRRVVNQRDQPVELHLVGGVVVVPPLGTAEISESDLDASQIRQLRRQSHLVVTPVASVQIQGEPGE